jgi:hypothetical protein
LQASSDTTPKLKSKAFSTINQIAQRKQQHAFQLLEASEALKNSSGLPAPSSTPAALFLDAALLRFSTGDLETSEQLVLRATHLHESEGNAGPDVKAAVSDIALKAMKFSVLPEHKQITHKALLFENLRKHEVAHVAPSTSFVRSRDELVEELKKLSVNNEAKVTKTEGDSLEGVKTFFLKDPHMQRGQGISIICFDEKDMSISGALPQFDDTKVYVLQPAIQPLLLDGRKFGLRVHALVITDEKNSQGNEHGLRLYSFKEAVLTKCGANYDEKSTDPFIQITCTSVQRSKAGFQRDQVGIVNCCLQFFFLENFLHCAFTNVFNRHYFVRLHLSR